MKMYRKALLIFFALLLSSVSHAQLTDSTLFQMFRQGSVALGGFRITGSYVMDSKPDIVIDGLDTVFFDFKSNWTPLFWTVDVSDSLSNLTIKGGENQGIDHWEFIMRCKIDTTHRLLTSLAYNFSGLMAVPMDYDQSAEGFAIDTVPYTLLNGTLSASLSGATLFQHLKHIDNIDQKRATGGEWYRLEEDTLIIDSPATASFTFTLNGPITKSVSQQPSSAPERLFPNPCKDVLNVTLGSANRSVAKESFTIYDELGRKCSVPTLHQTNPRELRLNVQALPNGTYLLVSREGSQVFSVVR